MNELTVKTNTEVANSFAHSTGGVGGEDLQIPTIILVQKMSKVVDSYGAKSGDIWDMMENKKLGDADAPVEFVPLALQKVWLVYKTGSGSREYLKTVPYDEANKHLPYHDTDGGDSIERVFAMNWFVLLKDQVDSGTAIPYRISFKSSSLRAAKKLNTLIAKNAARVPVYGHSYLLTSARETNDKATYNIMDVASGDMLPPSVLDSAAAWANMVAKPVTKPPADPLPFEVVSDEGTPFLRNPP